MGGLYHSLTLLLIKKKKKLFKLFRQDKNKKLCLGKDTLGTTVSQAKVGI